MLGVFVPEAAVLSLFRRLDLDGDGYLSQDEFVQAFHMIAGGGAAGGAGLGGFNPSGLLHPGDAFAMFDAKRRGALDEVDLALLLEYMGVETDDRRLHRLFRSADKDGSGLLEYGEFKAVWLRLVDAKAELQARGIRAGRWSTGGEVLRLLEAAVDREEAEQRAAVEVARRVQRRRQRQRQRRADAAECRALADEALAAALDACGSVFVFGGGARGELMEAPQPVPGGPGGLTIMRLWAERTGRGAIASRAREDEVRYGAVDLGSAKGAADVVERRLAIEQRGLSDAPGQGAGGDADDSDVSDDTGSETAAKPRGADGGSDGGGGGGGGADADDGGGADESDASSTEDEDEEDLPDASAMAAIVRDYNTPREGLGNRLALLKKMNELNCSA
ncbi:hypothetical protein FNF28_07532 [Cafeteria roenbergensis]|uniref:EF-hand domain-containing protein n=1 Tax=Cafeteria roenbergensis TaxID=33653 RepID=A0A5A8C3N6_CAFRO|nr:hypothetical protein FNF28_07532 [Cafeteria roenbergensis]